MRDFLADGAFWMFLVRMTHFAELRITVPALYGIVKDVCAYFTDKKIAYVLETLHVLLFEIEIFRVQVIMTISNCRLNSLLNKARIDP